MNASMERMVLGVLAVKTADPISTQFKRVEHEYTGTTPRTSRDGIPTGAGISGGMPKPNTIGTTASGAGSPGNFFGGAGRNMLANVADLSRFEQQTPVRQQGAQPA